MSAGQGFSAVVVGDVAGWWCGGLAALRFAVQLVGFPSRLQIPNLRVIPPVWTSQLNPGADSTHTQDGCSRHLFQPKSILRIQ